jgi:hypothetical protein
VLRLFKCRGCRVASGRSIIAADVTVLLFDVASRMMKA